MTIEPDYKWLAESIVMTDARLTEDILAALGSYARYGPTRSERGDRLGKLLDAITQVQDHPVEIAS
jgi:hypothetical protein